jgi:LmbE family N-acetylglucosaminyl deacetylase
VLDDAEIRRILVITAHPDDVDFGAAGTVARWTEAGIEVIYCVVTDGDAGGSDPSVSRSDMATLRRAEQTAAAKQVGVHDVRFLGYPDGRVEATLGLRKDLARVIRQVRPDRVVCPSPERNYARIGTSHPDHRAVGSAARWTRSTRTPATRSRFPACWPTRNSALDRTREVWIAGGPTPDHYVDVTDTFSRKVAALRAHESQLSDPDGIEARLRGWLAGAATAAGLPDGRLAEAFQVLQTG